MPIFYLPIPFAQEAPLQKDATSLVVWGGLAFGGIALLLVSVVFIRRKFFPKESPDSAPAGFGVSQLKDLYDQGLLTDDEFNAAKAKIVAESHAAYMALGKKKSGTKA